MNYKLPLLCSLLTGALVISCQDHRIPAPETVKVSTFATGLASPIGLETDASGRVWVTEAGTGKNDGKVSVITPDGKVYPVITGFDSEVFQGSELDGLNHLLFADGLLYVLGSKSRLYSVNIASFKPGDTPLSATSLPVEDVSKFIIDFPFPADQDTGESHLYNMTVGPNGDLFFSDAAANAIIRRTKAGVWSVFANIPRLKNPTPVGPPFIDSVPTGIVFDGKNLLVTTLVGFPFPKGASIVYQVDQSAAISVFKQGFTSLVDLNLDTDLGLLLIQHGVFGQQGFGAKTGQVIQVTASGSSVLVDGLNLPTDLRQIDAHTAYVSSLGDGSVLKVTY
ncbi:ScyD/ScyE family protein [Spirosoma pollinicola]|uniref:ScyD/ScyE family protein n=1 Tax=Spirosoma pollinicola TaxID=2057025 RepID=A0A2K8ZBG4_9BACT|nr:ScyD/ScyE family protein [Spirosoma pollinicola]AUD07226.1 ScyD/ScyE family protein [Spirosoma pollinicola]